MNRLTKLFVFYVPIGWGPFLIFTFLVGDTKHFLLAIGACAISFAIVIAIDRTMWRAAELFHGGNDRAARPWGIASRVLTLITSVLHVSGIFAFPMILPLNGTLPWIGYVCVSLWLLIPVAVALVGAIGQISNR